MITLNQTVSLRFSNMGLFIGEKGWIHPTISTPTYELIFVMKGVVYLEENGIPYEINKGEIICLRPDVIHRGYKKSDDCSFFWLHFHAENYQNIGLYRTVTNNFSSVVILFQELNHLAMLPNKTALIECKLLTFLLEMKQETSSNSKLFSDIAEYLRVHINSVFKVSQISQIFGYHPDHLSRLFKENCGLPLKKYIDQIRLNFICDKLLTTLLSVKQIADLCNFESDNSLIKFFKYHKNKTPSEYRNSICFSHINNK